MADTRLSQRQLAELTQRAYKKLRERRAGEIIEGESISLDDAVDRITRDSSITLAEVGVSKGITEEDILAAYQDMQNPSLYHHFFAAVRGGSWKRKIGYAAVVLIGGFSFYFSDANVAQRELQSAQQESNAEVRSEKTITALLSYFLSEAAQDKYLGKPAAQVIKQGLSEGTSPQDFLALANAVCDGDCLFPDSIFAYDHALKRYSISVDDGIRLLDTARERVRKRKFKFTPQEVVEEAISYFPKGLLKE